MIYVCGKEIKNMKNDNVLYFALAVFSAYSLRFCFYIDIYNIMANSIFSVFLVFIFYKLLSQMKIISFTSFILY